MAEVLWIQEERHPGQGQPKQGVDPVWSFQYQPQTRLHTATDRLVRILQDVAEIVFLDLEPGARRTRGPA